MPHELDSVQPGDLITAEYFNDLVGELLALEARVIALELGAGGNSLAILGRIPGGPYRIGDELQIIGRNFEYTLGAARVFLDATPVSNFDDTASSNERLVFDIPAVSGVEEAGTEVELRVLNSTQSVSETIILQPRVGVLFGNVDIEWRSVDPTTVEAGQPATFEFRAQSRASETAVFTIAPEVTGEDVDSSLWQSRLEVLDEAGSPLPGNQLELVPLPSGSPRTFSVRITEVPTGTEGTEAVLEVVATANGVTGTEAKDFVVGEETEPADPDISLIPLFSLPPSALDGLDLTAALNQQVTVHYTADFTLAPGVSASYEVTLEPSAATTGWNPTLVSSSGPTAPPTTSPIQFTVRPTSGASATGLLVLRVRRQGATASTTRNFNLILA